MKIEINNETSASALRHLGNALIAIASDQEQPVVTTPEATTPPAPEATTPPAPEATTPPAPEYDAAGLPWDERIHASTRGKTNAGVWKIRRKPGNIPNKDEWERYVHAVTTELANQVTPPAPEATTPPAPEATTPPAPEATTPPAPEATTPPAPEATTPPAPEATTPPSPEATTPPAPEATTPPAPENVTVQDLVALLRRNGGVADGKSMLDQVIARHGVAGDNPFSVLISHRRDLIPAVYVEFKELIES